MKKIILKKVSKLRTANIEIDVDKKHFWTEQRYNTGLVKYSGGQVQSLKRYLRDRIIINKFEIIQGKEFVDAILSSKS